MSEKQFLIRVKNQCGTNRGYPASNLAELFIDLLEPRKTFTTEQVEKIQKIGQVCGFVIEYEMVEMREVVVPA